MATNVEALTNQLAQDDGQTQALMQIAESQDAVRQILEANSATEEEPVDAESRMRLRSIDVQMLRILEEMQAGRQESLADLRGDLATLTHVIRVASGQEQG